MEPRLPPLNALRAFEAAARLGSFSAAAEILHVTHGAVSRQIRTLEEWLAMPLFERRGRRVLLTEAGREYYHAVQSAFHTIAGATRRVTEAGTKRRITIDALPTFTMHWLLPRLTRFQQRHPTVELNLITSERAPGINAGSFDIAIRRSPQDVPGCQTRDFLVEQEIPVCSPALLKRIPLKTARDLRHHTLLSSAGRPQSWSRWLNAAGMADLEIHRRQQFDHFYLTLQAAVDGIGVALGPRPVIDGELAAGRLITPLPGPVVRARAYCWILSDAKAGDPLLRTFCDWLEQEADERNANVNASANNADWANQDG
jgi:LysR family glycine cleavage system transcriptional activator